jgi:hypothetical protein
MKEIEFITEDPLIAETFPPRPAKDALPEWYKSIPNIDLKSLNKGNVKNCLPVDDYISAGYIVFNAYQIHLEEKFVNFQNHLYVSTMKQVKNKDFQNFNYNQCPYSDQPKDIFKIKTDWRIKTPLGYSCLIQQPAYIKNPKWKLFPSIIDTDEYDDVISVAGIVLDKNITYMNPGDPLIQIIPFKRDDWFMTTSIGSINSKTSHYLFEAYKNLFHKIKKFI